MIPWMQMRAPRTRLVVSYNLVPCTMYFFVKHHVYDPSPPDYLSFELVAEFNASTRPTSFLVLRADLRILHVI